MTREEAQSLRDDLLETFDHYGVEVAVGVTQKGVAIRSQDERVDATNLGVVNPLPAPTGPPVTVPPAVPTPHPNTWPEPRRLPGEPYIID